MPSIEYRAPVTFQNEGDARIWLANERRLIESGGWSPPAERLAAAQQARAASVSLSEYATGWLARADLAATTVARYRGLLRYYILAEPVPSPSPKKPPQYRTRHGIGDVCLDSLTTPIIAAWWQALPLKTLRRSCDQAYSLLRTILYAAIDGGLMTSNPCKVRGAGRPSVRRSIPEPLTPAQVAAVADAMPERWRLGVLLGTWCAMRSGEIRELRRKDIDIAAGVIHVSRTVIYVDRQQTAKAPKTAAGIRSVPIPNAILADVKNHLSDFTQIGPEGLLFYSPAGHQVIDSEWRKAFVVACAENGISGVRFHDLRHIGLTYMAGVGATVKELQAVAGHTTATMAMRYQEVAGQHMAQVTSELSDMITSSS